MSTAPPPYTDDKSQNMYQGAPPAGQPFMQQPVFIGTPMFIPSEYPVQCVCPRCHQPIVTRLEKNSGLLTWLLVGGLFLFGCWLGCCFIPLCVDDCKDTAHFCPSCSQLLGVKKKL